MKFLTGILLLFWFSAFAQETETTIARDTTFFTKIDTLYREDQFYFALTYNNLTNTPSYFDKNGIPLGIHFGFLRDMPINSARTTSIGLGVGFSYNKYHHNLKMVEENGVVNYEIVNKNTISRNKLELVYVEIPLELRFRNSTPQSHKFFRFHVGFKLRYLAFSKSKYIGLDGVHKIFNNKDFDKIQYGPTLSFGYNTWNFYGYYGINSLMKKGEINDQKADFNAFNLGLIFYIL